MKKQVGWGLLPVLCMALAPSAQAAIIGPAVNDTFTGVDTAGERINLDALAATAFLRRRR